MTMPAFIAASALSFALLAGALPSSARAEQLAARTRGPASPPPAFLDFCARNPAECRRSGALTRQVVLTPERQRDLQEVNARVNSAISEISDREHHGREDVWSIPTDGQGDCEDFALSKRKQLIERGWPSSALLIAVVGTPTGEGHAVLMATTSEGDLVLDNKTSRMLPWTQTGYLFFTRMSQSNPRAWEAIDGGNIAVTAATRRPYRP
ncbi:transglutaminase-like cysteine peptidase [Bosea sp. (in: a-proteobacteria)]|jgi:predicted transglutaminase-like cysteine proteinase|uniref:transglutaminase-like cysteine peptidase n=1 Tax=Bosea sp. (in: a-proteobacteria) TaxID=1871050 RepID=UPI002DDD7665|nr:transglutaminase-like cysteine peptidase [Bosea sp. (in: a-proteobacteria)]HEV2508291.1 transglutaminase-like cysteine peptidase [Bosea sp. (in: a-proteobacteria)]